uniref:Caprin-1 dimerization domain-containing protein n=3 Tax=Plectus sambesii TaxID=2011161 RepID=A0A914VZT4_9BILA
MPAATTKPVVAADTKQVPSKEGSKEPDNSNPIQKVVEMVEKKIRNLEKRRLKLDQYQEDQKNGKELTPEQLVAVSRIADVEQQLDFARDIQKNVQAQLKDYQKTIKETQKREFRERQQNEVGRIRELLQYQEMLNLLGKEPVKQAFMNGTDGAVKLSSEEIKLCDELFAVICPSMENVTSGEWRDKLESASQRAFSLLTGSQKHLIGDSDGKSLKNLLDRIVSCEYVSHNRGGSPDSKNVDDSDRASPSGGDEAAASVTSTSPDISAPTSKKNSVPNVVFVSNGQPTGPITTGVHFLSGDEIVSGGHLPMQSAYPSQANYHPYNVHQVYSSGAALQNIGYNYPSATMSAPDPPPPIPLPGDLHSHPMMPSPPAHAKPLDPNAPTFVSDDGTTGSAQRMDGAVHDKSSAEAFAPDESSGGRGGRGYRERGGGARGGNRGGGSGFYRGRGGFRGSRDGGNDGGGSYRYHQSSGQPRGGGGGVRGGVRGGNRGGGGGGGRSRGGPGDGAHA